MKRLLLAVAAVVALAASPALAANYVEGAIGVGTPALGATGQSITPDVSVIAGTTVPFLPLRLEVEGSHEFNDAGKYGDVNATLLGLNVAYDLPTVNVAKVALRPYVFVGAGEAFLGGSGSAGKTSDEGAFYALGGGVNHQLDANWAVGARYRFVNSNITEFNNTPAKTSFRENAVQVTLTRTF